MSLNGIVEFWAQTHTSPVNRWVWTLFFFLLPVQKIFLDTLFRNSVVRKLWIHLLPFLQQNNSLNPTGPRFLHWVGEFCSGLGESAGRALVPTAAPQNERVYAPFACVCLTGWFWLPSALKMTTSMLWRQRSKEPVPQRRQRGRKRKREPRKTTTSMWRCHFPASRPFFTQSSLDMFVCRCSEDDILKELEELSLEAQGGQGKVTHSKDAHHIFQ